MYDLIRFWDRVINFSDILLDEKLYEQKNKDMFMTFHTKRQRVQKHSVLGSIKYTDLLKFIIKLDLQYYLIIDIVIKLMIRLIIL